MGQRSHDCCKSVNSMQFSQGKSENHNEYTRRHNQRNVRHNKKVRHELQVAGKNCQVNFLVKF
jgi:hypothetical protein